MSCNLKLAIIGCGKWGINHVTTAQQILDDQNIFVCDLSEENREKIEGLSPHLYFTTNLQDILQNSDINNVIIATPAPTHYSIAQKCLEAHKNILVEKPITLFLDQAINLKKIALQQNLILQVGHLLLFHPAIQKIKSLIGTGKLGKLQYIYSNRLNLGTVRTEENILWSFAPHDISILNYLTGTLPITVNASGGAFLQPGIHDVTVTTLGYPNNIQAHIHVSWLHPFKEHRLVVIGSKSMAVFEGTKNQLVLYPKGIDYVDGEPKTREQNSECFTFENEKQPLTLQLEHFLQCITNKALPLCSVDDGIAVLQILEKAQKCLLPEKKPTGSQKKFWIHETAIVDEPCHIGDGTKIWHFSHIQSNAKIGKNCTLGQNVNVANHVQIGNYVKIQNNVSIYEGVELEDYVFCGPSMVFTNITVPRCEYPQQGSKFYQKTLVKYGTSIGANATILCGVTIGCFAFIGAGAVVTKNVPDYALVIGNPAKVVGWICRCGQRLEFASPSSFCCKCKRVYQKDSDVVFCQNEEMQ